MKIRKATINDLDGLAKVDWGSWHPRLKDWAKSIEDIRASLKKRFDKEDEEMFLYEDDGAVKGYVSFKSDFPGWNHCEVCWIAVKKEFQREGIGGRLLGFIEEYAKKMGFRRIMAYTGIDNPQSNDFYLKSGYVRIYEFGDFYGFEFGRKTAVLYGKWLKEKNKEKIN